MINGRVGNLVAANPGLSASKKQRLSLPAELRKPESAGAAFPSGSSHVGPASKNVAQKSPASKWFAKGEVRDRKAAGKLTRDRMTATQTR